MAFTSYTDNSGNSYFAIFGGNSKLGRLNDLCILDLATFQWKKYYMTEDIEGLDALVMNYHEKIFYIISGITDQTVLADPYLLKFDLGQEAWTYKKYTDDAQYIPCILSGSAIYDGYMYLFYGWNTPTSSDIEKVYRMSLADPDYAWTEVDVDDDDGVGHNSYAAVLVGSKFYIFGGYTKDDIRNDLFSIELAPTASVNPKHEQVNGNYNAPSPRVFHCMEAVNGKLFVFGGDSSGEKMNDLWEWDAENKVWSLMIGNGIIPTERSHHACTSHGDYMIIWGGIGNSGLLNDAYKYSVSRNTWDILETVSDIVPSPRSSACAALETPYLYIYGGMTETGLSSELWEYNTGAYTYTRLDTNNRFGPGKIHKQRCSIDKNGRLYVMMGTAEADNAKGEIHYYNFTNQGNWTKEYKLEKDQTRNGALVLNIDNNFLIAGGEKWGIYIYKDIFEFSSQHQGALTSSLEDHFVNGAFAFLQNYVYMFGGSNPLDTIHRATTPSNTMIRFNLLDDEFSRFTHKCSLGSYYDSEKKSCILASPGHYVDKFNTDGLMSKGYPCEIGFYNEFSGASSKSQCFPCPEGTYNEKTGMHYCLDCPAQAECTIGSNKPSYDIFDYYTFSNQPPFFKPKHEEAYWWSVYLIIVLTFLLLLAFIILLVWKGKKTLAKWFDIYDNLHYDKEGEPLIIKKNMIGSIFGMIFWGVAFGMIAYTIPRYAIDNLEETKSLIPFELLEQKEDFRSEIYIELTLKGYRGRCTDEISIGSDDSEHKLSCSYTVDFRKVIETNHIDCIISLVYSDCTINSSNLVKFTLSDSDSYANGIIANVTTSSSIPGELSTAIQQIDAPQNKVFRGYPPSVLYFTMIPSVYEEADQDDRRGYHTVISRVPDQGSTTFTHDIGYTSDMLIDIDINRSDYSVLTSRIRKETLFLLLFTLLGSIFGAMEALGTIMNSIEERNSNYLEKREKRRQKVEIEKRKKQLKAIMIDPPDFDPDTDELIQRQVNDTDSFYNNA